LIALLLATTAHAGVWVRDRGDTWLQLAVQHAEATHAFDTEGVLRDQTAEAFVGDIDPLFDEARTSITDLTAYGEVGLGHGFELDLSVPVRYATDRWGFAQGSSPDMRHEHAGLGDATIAGRFGTVRGRWAASVLAGVRLPLYDNALVVLHTQPGNADFYDDNLPLGNGTIDFDLSLGGGTSWGWGWALFEAGGRIRNRQYSAALPGRVQVGFKPWKPLALWLSADGMRSLGNGRAPDFYVDEWNKGPTVIDDQSFVGASAGLSIDVSDTVGFYGTGSRILAGQRYPQLTSVAGGIVLHFDIHVARPTPAAAPVEDAG
jgi:hypothetical protein